MKNISNYKNFGLSISNRRVGGGIGGRNKKGPSSKENGQMR